MVSEDVKLENVLSPTEMFARFGEVGDWVVRGNDVYINSFYLAAELLRTAHERINCEDMARNVPYAYRRIVERAKNYRGPSIFDAVLERRLIIS